MNKYLIGISVVLLLAVAGGYFATSSRIDGVVTQVNDLLSQAVSKFGASSGQTHSFPEDFLDRIFVSRQGNLNFGTIPGVTTTTIPQSATTTVSSNFNWKTVCENTVIDVFAPTSGNLTFPSSSYLGNNCLKKPGETRTIFIENAGSSTFFTLQTSDQSSTLKAISATAATSSLNAKDFAQVSIMRITSSTYSSTGTITATTPWYFYLVTVFR